MILTLWCVGSPRSSLSESLQFSGKPAPAPVVEQPTIANVVYITNTGEKYHKSGCRYLKDSKIEISLSEAQSQGYDACGVCKP